MYCPHQSENFTFGCTVATLGFVSVLLVNATTCSFPQYFERAPGFFLEMYFRGEIAFVGRENVKNIQKTNTIYLLFGGEI